MPTPAKKPATTPATPKAGTTSSKSASSAASSRPASASATTAKKAATNPAAKTAAAPAKKSAPSPAKAPATPAGSTKAAPAAAGKAAAPSTTKAAAPAAKVAPAPAKAAAKAPAKKAFEKPGPVKPHGPAFDAKFLDSQHKLLMEERAKLLGQAKSLEDEAAQLMEDLDPGDVQFDDESGEGDSLVVERERDLALSQQARQMISDIDAALARLRDGTYGYSLVSGRSIPRERLKALPWATELVEEKVGGLGRR